MKYLPIIDLKRADYNPRVMPDAEMQSLMKSIETHGFVEPIVVNINPDRFGIIVGGHQRLTAVQNLIAKGIIPKGIKDVDAELIAEAREKSGQKIGVYRVPVFEVDLTLEAEKQLNIGLNKIHGKFDEDKLFDLIVGMKDSPNIESTGFSNDDISGILDGGEQGSKETHSFKAECTRCMELKLQTLGHAKRSGHPIKFEENVKE